MRDIKTVSQIDDIRQALKHIFPDAVRGSVCKSKWGSKSKQLHLAYWVASDTVGGLIIEAQGDMFYFYNWDSNTGRNNMFAESEMMDMINRIKSMYDKRVLYITKMVGEK